MNCKAACQFLEWPARVPRPASFDDGVGRASERGVVLGADDLPLETVEEDPGDEEREVRDAPWLLTLTLVGQAGETPPGGRRAEGDREPCWLLDESFEQLDEVELRRLRTIRPAARSWLHAHQLLEESGQVPLFTIASTSARASTIVKRRRAFGKPARSRWRGGALLVEIAFRGRFAGTAEERFRAPSPPRPTARRPRWWRVTWPARTLQARAGARRWRRRVPCGRDPAISRGGGHEKAWRSSGRMPFRGARHRCRASVGHSGGGIHMVR